MWKLDEAYTHVFVLPTVTPVVQATRHKLLGDVIDDNLDKNAQNLRQFLKHKFEFLSCQSAKTITGYNH